MFRSLAALFIISLSTYSFAGTNLVQNAIITEVSNTSSNTPNFSVKTSGGTGVCTGGQWIVFSLEDASDAATHQRAYASALLALSAGLKVRIYNYIDGTCQHAGYIELSK